MMSRGRCRRKEVMVEGGRRHWRQRSASLPPHILPGPRSGQPELNELAERAR
jgi:hypothetical protein